VVLQDVTVFNAGESVTGVQIVNWQRALLLDSSIRFSGIFGPNPGGAVSAQDSELWIANTEVLGNNDCCFATRASHAVEVVNSTLHVWRSQIRSGNGGAEQGCGRLADGGTGARDDHGLRLPLRSALPPIQSSAEVSLCCFHALLALWSDWRRSRPSSRPAS
jgi:transposase-like protein